MFVRYIMSFTEAYFIFRAHKAAARFDTDSCLTIVASVRQHARPTYPVGDEVVRVFPWLVTVRWHHQTSRRSIWHRHGKGQSGRRPFFLLREWVFVLGCAHVQHRGLMACMTRALTALINSDSVQLTKWSGLMKCRDSTFWQEIRNHQLRLTTNISFW